MSEAPLEMLEIAEEDLADRLREVRKRIRSHPEHKEKFLPKALAEQVEWVREARGRTRWRKSDMEWFGFEFSVDGKVYEARQGSNWWYDFKDVIGPGINEDLVTNYSLFEGEGFFDEEDPDSDELFEEYKARIISKVASSDEPLPVRVAQALFLANPEW